MISKIYQTGNHSNHFSESLSFIIRRYIESSLFLLVVLLNLWASKRWEIFLNSSSLGILLDLDELFMYLSSSFLMNRGNA
mmetsp:Transcript_13451/g.21281  ORF Transcript_13451/g.21281 Transcript_13451/m.21281 type:complete len:80 (-) Transcript_13451:1416-1655(-)